MSPKNVLHSGKLQSATVAAQNDDRIAQVMNEYLEALEAGLRPDRRSMLERHPDIAQELADCLDGLDFIHQAAPDLNSARDLADELQRYLDEKPVQVKRPTVQRESKSKWSLYQRAIVATAIVAAVVCLSLASIFLRREQDLTITNTKSRHFHSRSTRRWKNHPPMSVLIGLKSTTRV